MRALAMASVALLLTVAFAGCNDDPGSGDGTTTSSSSGTSTAASNTTTSAASNTTTSRSSTTTTSSSNNTTTSSSSTTTTSSSNGTGNQTGNQTGNSTTNQTATPLQHNELEWQVGAQWACGLVLNPLSPAGPVLVNGVQVAYVAVDPLTIGKTFTATFGAGAPDHVSAVIGSERMWFSSVAAANLGDFATAVSTTVTDVVPDGAEVVVFTSCAVTGNTVTYSVAA